MCVRKATRPFQGEWPNLFLQYLQAEHQIELSVVIIDVQFQGVLNLSHALQEGAAVNMQRSCGLRGVETVGEVCAEGFDVFAVFPVIRFMQCQKPLGTD